MKKFKIIKKIKPKIKSVTEIKKSSFKSNSSTQFQSKILENRKKPLVFKKSSLEALSSGSSEISSETIDSVPAEPLNSKPEERFSDEPNRPDFYSSKSKENDNKYSSSPSLSGDTRNSYSSVPNAREPERTQDIRDPHDAFEKKYEMKDDNPLNIKKKRNLL